MGPRIVLNFVSSPAEHDRECEGHESLRGDAMGAEVYCATAHAGLRGLR